MKLTQNQKVKTRLYFNLDLGYEMKQELRFCIIVFPRQKVSSILFYGARGTKPQMGAQEHIFILKKVQKTEKKLLSKLEWFNCWFNCLEVLAKNLHYSPYERVR